MKLLWPTIEFVCVFLCVHLAIGFILNNFRNEKYAIVALLITIAFFLGYFYGKKTKK